MSNVLNANKTMTYLEVLKKAQEYMSNFLFDTERFTNEEVIKFKKNLNSFLTENQILCDGVETISDLVTRLYNSMVWYDCLTQYLEDDKINELGIEEIYGQWNCIYIVTKDKVINIKEKFPSPEYAKNIINRIVRRSKKSNEVNEGTPISLGEFKMSVRYGAVGEPVCPSNTGVTFAIRIVKANDIDKNFIISKKTATPEQAEFLLMCARYGANICFCGKVHSGKTGSMSFIINELKKDPLYRIGTVEHESRELNPFVYDNKGNVINNAFSWVTRPSTDKNQSIEATDLVATMLRFSADLGAFGEMRGAETYAVVRAGNTGQAIIATTHANSAKSAYSSIVTLCKTAGIPFDDKTLYNMAIEAFPIIAYQHENTDQYGNKSRKIVEIAEGLEFKDGHVIINPIYKYEIQNSTSIDGKQITDGEVKKVGTLSHDLKQRLLLNDCPSDKVEKYA